MILSKFVWIATVFVSLVGAGTTDAVKPASHGLLAQLVRISSEHSSSDTMSESKKATSSDALKSAGSASETVSSTVPAMSESTMSASRSKNSDGKHTSAANVDKLWRGISVSSTSAKLPKPTDLSSKELEPPPNMPSWDNNHTLPHNFVWGVASSAYQIEGAVKEDGRGPSIMDKLVHKGNGTGLISTNGSNGDISANHYHFYKQDAKRLKALGFPYYGMSISWSRIQPFGNGTVNEKGLKHYEEEVDYLLSQGIQPIVTLLHFDTPLALQGDFGGCQGSQFAHYFANYAKIVFDKLGSKVKYWITINDPDMFSKILGTVACSNVTLDVYDSKCKNGTETAFSCVHNLLLAHAKAVKYFRKHIQPNHPGSLISYKDGFSMSVPYSDSEADCAAANRSLDFGRLFSEPIFGNGEYPKVVRETIPGQIMPNISSEEKKLIQGSADFFAWNAYAGNAASEPHGGVGKCTADPSHELYPVCVNTTFANKYGWSLGTVGEDSEFYATPPDIFRKGLKYISEKYSPKGGIWVSEFGFPQAHEDKMGVPGARYDTERVDFYTDSLKAILEAVNTDRINVTGALAWAAMDGFEYMDGYRSKFGIQHVDLNNETLERTFKKSAFVFSDFFKTHVESGDLVSNQTEPHASSAGSSTEDASSLSAARTTTATEASESLASKNESSITMAAVAESTGSKTSSTESSATEPAKRVLIGEPNDINTSNEATAHEIGDRGLQVEALKEPTLTESADNSFETSPGIRVSATGGSS